MDNSEVATQLVEYDRALLTTYVRQVYEHHTLELDNWQVEPLQEGAGHATGGIYRIKGTGQDRGAQIDWSLIVKVLRDYASRSFFTGAPMQIHALYWKREALAYRSGILDDLPSGLVAPRCLAVLEQSDGSIWLWLEELHDSYGLRWPLEQYARAARCLGRFNGAYLSGRSLPSFEWLGHSGSLHGMLESSGWVRSVFLDPAAWSHPTIRRAFPVPVADRLLQLWDERSFFLDLLKRMPLTLCHKDFWRDNLFAPQQDTLAVIDWAVLGTGELGLDAGNLLGASWHRCRVETADLQALDTAIFESYLAGLNESGWQCNRRMLRIAYLGVASLKYSCWVLALLVRTLLDEPESPRWSGLLDGLSMDEFFDYQGTMAYYLLDLTDEARKMLQSR